MIEGIIIGFACGAIIPVGIGAMGARFISKHPEIVGRFMARKMMGRK